MVEKESCEGIKYDFTLSKMALTAGLGRPRCKLSLDGIVILGSLIIGPNYKENLIFGLYNLSSHNYPLLPGKKLVAGVFYKFDKKSD